MKRPLYLLLFVVSFTSCQFFKGEDTVENIYGKEGDTAYIEYNTLIFKRLRLTDSVITRQEYLSLLVPESYHETVATKWNIYDFTDPFKYYIQLSDSAITNTITFYPSITFITHTSSLPMDISPIDMFQDSIYETSRLPKNALDAVTDYVIPIYLKNVSNYRIKIKKPLFNIHQIDEQGKERIDESACIHIEYNEGDNIYEQIIYACLEKRFLQVESYNSTCEWRIKNIASVKSAKGMLDYHLAIFQTVLNSATTTPSWAYYYDYLCKNNFRDKKSISINDYINRFAHTPPISEAQELTIFHTKQNTLRKIYAAYTMYLNNIEFYFDKDESSVALPKGYLAAWSSTDNRLLVTEIPNYKPTGSEEVAWVQIRKNESQMLYHFLEGSSAPEVGDPLFENDLFH